MLLDQLLHEVSIHYRSRGFPNSALIHLRWVLINNIRGEHIVIATEYHKYLRKVSELIGHFEPCPKQEALSDLNEAQAIFGFAFGYQLKDMSNQNPENRLPGDNNKALAQIALDLHNSTKLPLYLQFEIADAISDQRCIKTPIKDLGTFHVAKSFIEQSNGIKFKKVIIVAHQHHMERCRIILKDDLGIEGIPSPTMYQDYDDFEAQPRVMSPEEFIISDFISMAARKK